MPNVREMTQIVKWPEYLRLAQTDTARQRFDTKIERTPDGCWEWRGARSTDGYGIFTYLTCSVRAHRLSYVMHRGPFEPTLVIDHLCRNRMCVNPDHLETVTDVENVMRGESFSALRSVSATCPNGHVYQAEAHIDKRGRRFCTVCRAATLVREGALKRSRYAAARAMGQHWSQISRSASGSTNTEAP